MTNNPRRLPVAASAAPRSTLELLDNVPESLLRRLKQYSGRFATEAVAAMQERLPFFAELEASQRASVQLVVQAAVVNFAEWMRNPHSNVGFTVQAFELVPQDLTRRIALRQTVDMVRLTMEFFEEVVPMLAGEEHATALTTGILRYSRDLAFTAASAYADAAEARGAWDSRMEANLVDAVVRGDTGPELQSRAAALNWDTTAPATVVVGLPRQDRIDVASDDVREIAHRHTRSALSDVHGTWLIAIVSGQLAQTEKFLRDLIEVFADGPVVIGPTAPTFTAAHTSAIEALAGMNAVAGWTSAPRPVLARELLPERALLGRRVGDRGARCRGDAAAGRCRAGADGDPGRIPRLRRGHRGLRAQIVRSSKYGPLPAQADHGLHRPRSHHAAGRIRAEGGGNRRSAVFSSDQSDLGLSPCCPGHTFSPAGIAPVEGCISVSMESHHMLFCGEPTKT